MGNLGRGTVSGKGRRGPSALRIVFVVCLVVAMAFGGLVAFAWRRAEDAKAPEVSVADPVLEGTWEIDSASRDGNPCLVSELEVVRSLHMSRYLTLAPDGKATLELLGAKIKGTWDASETSSSRMGMELSRLDDLGLADAWDLNLDGQYLVVSGNGWMVRLFRIDAVDKQDERVDLGELGRMAGVPGV